MADPNELDPGSTSPDDDEAQESDVTRVSDATLANEPILGEASLTAEEAEEDADLDEDEEDDDEDDDDEDEETGLEVEDDEVPIP